MSRGIHACGRLAADLGSIMTQIPGYPGASEWQPQAPEHYGVGPPKTSGYAIASLVCSLVGALTCCTIVPSVLGIVFGGIALGPTKRGEARGRGLAISGIIVGIFGLLLGAAFWILAVQAPANTPISGAEVSEADRDALLSMGVLDEGEDIELFYPAGFFSIRESGVLITAERLVLYWENAETQACRLEDIRAIDFTPAASWLEEGQFLIECEDGELMLFSVDGQDASDQLFHRVLRRQVDQARKAAGNPPAKSEVTPSDDGELDDEGD
jgi:hypothetical protein